MRAGVIGGGTMGVGIAYVLAAHDIETSVVEPDDDRARALRDTLAATARAGVERGRLDPELGAGLAGAVHRVTTVDDLPPRLDVLIESVPESLELKQHVLVEAERTGPRLLATNTSTLSIDRLAEPLERPDGFLGLHFFNPVWSLALVEIVRGRATSEAALRAALEVVDAMGKQPAVINDAPGFATSRLDTNSALEAMRMVQDGVASPADIDRAVRLAYRHPVGPLHLSDVVGLDVRLDTARTLARALGERFEPPRLLVELVEQGHLGRKSGQGFYRWDGERIVDDEPPVDLSSTHLLTD